MKNTEKIEPYKHDVVTCAKKIIGQWKKDDETITNAYFDLMNISRIGATPKRHKTGQHVFITRKTKSGKEKTQKTFMGHEYCPFCGKKF